MRAIIIGLVSGIVSGTGMGGGTILIFLLTNICGLEHSTSNKFNIFYSNINCCNNCKYKKQKYTIKSCNNNFIIWSLGSNCRSKFINSYRCKQIKKNVWNIFVNYCYT